MATTTAENNNHGLDHANLVSVIKQMPGLYDQLKAQGDPPPPISHLQHQQMSPSSSSALATQNRQRSTSRPPSVPSVPRPLQPDQMQANYEPSVGGDSSHEQELDDDFEDDEDQQTGKKRRRKNEGSEEWARQRKDNHKEVERRRRGTINDGINELGRIVPNATGDKAKGAILSRAVQYIHHLKENEARNIEKWTLEKLLMDQAMGDVQQQLEDMRTSLQRERDTREALEKELEALRRLPA